MTPMRLHRDGIAARRVTCIRAACELDHAIRQRMPCAIEILCQSYL
jgi:hypothetical protein